MEESNRLEELKRKLYMNRDTDSLTESKKSVLHDIMHKAPKSWDAVKPALETGTRMMKKNSFFKKFFITAMVFFLIAMGFFAVMTFRGGNTVSNKNIDLEILGNAFTPGGNKLTLEALATNRNNVSIELADLILEYPKGSTSNQVEDRVRIRESFGTIGAGETKHHAFDVVLYGEQGSVKQMKMTLEYKIPGSNALFSKSIDYSVTLSASPLSLTIDGPTTTSANQRYAFTVKTVLNGENIAQNMILRVDYPPGFSFENANVQPMLGDNVFDLGDMRTGVSKEIRISGTLSGEQGEEKVFRIYAGEQKQDDQSTVGVTYNSLPHSVTLQKPFLDAHFEMSGGNKDTYVVSGGSTVNGSIVWSNNSPSSIANAEISTTIIGQAFDEGTLQVDGGYYDARTNTITWNRDTYPGFAQIETGGSGVLPFSFTTKTMSSSGSSVSPEISIVVNSKGLQTGDGYQNEELTSIDKKTIKFGSDFSVNGNIVHGSNDTGVIPPVMGKETTYTVTWSISNSTDPVSNAIVRTTLPTGIKWGDVVNKSDEDISYNDLNKEVIWKVGAVKKLGAGLIRKASFKIKVIPANNQVGEDLTLLNTSTVTATDSFSGNDIRSTLKGYRSSDVAGSGDGLVTK